MNRRMILLAALAATILAIVLARIYVSSREDELNRAREQLNERYRTIEVLCFSRDVSGGAIIELDDLGVKDVPRIGLRGQALTREQLSEVVGRKTIVSHHKGDVVFWSDIEGGNPRSVGLSTDIKRHMRAISINVSGSAGVSGMINPGDRVDVIGTFDFPVEGSTQKIGNIATYTILQNVLVLATGRETAKTATINNNGQRANYSMVTLEVSPREAEMLAFSEQMNGRFVLTLRNSSDVSYEKNLDKVDFNKIRGEIESLNEVRQQKLGVR